MNNLSPTLKTLCALFVLAQLTACGGGDSDSSATNSTNQPTVAPTAPPSAAPTPTATPEPTPVVNVALNTTDIIAPADFDFTPINSVSVQVDLSQYSQQRAFFSLYQQYQTTTAGMITPLYASRIVASPLIAGKLTTQIQVAKDQQTVLAEVWFYDGSEPLQRTLTISQGQLIW